MIASSSRPAAVPSDGIRPTRRTQRRIFSVLIMSCVLVGCSSGANNEDKRRVAKMRSYELLRTAPGGAEVTDKPYYFMSESDNPKFDRGGLHM